MERTLKIKKKKDIHTILSDNMLMVPTNSLKKYPKNPRVGNIEKIKESILNNGFAKVLLAQKSTRYVLDGNHTWQAASEMGYPMVPVALLDVDDEVAARIVLAANRLNDIATYDSDLLAEVLKGLGSPLGTGYSDEDYRALMQAVEDSAVGLPTITDDPVFGGIDPLQPPSIEPPDTDDDGDLEVAEEVLPGIAQLQNPEDVEFDGVGYWGIPRLRIDMLVLPEDIPANLLAWAGSATKDWPDPDQWWLYNVGVDSTSGMRDVSKVIVSFYTWDDYFETWWVYTDRWVSKLLNSKITMALTPDFSTMANWPQVKNLYNIYKSRFVGRYLQDAGIKLIPHVTWPAGDMHFFDKYVRATLPKKLPTVSFQCQTFDSKATVEEVEEYKKTALYIMEQCNADHFLIYAGKRGAEMLHDMNLDNFSVQIVMARQEALAEKAKNKSKKTTI